MKYDILKSVSLLALFAAFTTVMFACDNTNDPSAPERTQTPSSSSAMPLYSSVAVTEVSPIRFLPPTVTFNGDKSRINFQGSAALDGFDTTASVDNDNDPFFTNISLDLVHVNEAGQNEVAMVQLQYTPPTFPVAQINLAEMGTVLYDPDKVQCGTFKLIVVLYATNDAAAPNKFISTDSVEFVREPEFCIDEPEPVSSSSEPIAVVELNQFQGQMTTSNFKGFSLKTDQEVDAAQAEFQVSLSQEGQLTLIGLNGYKVAKYSNADQKPYNDDWYSQELPPAPAHMSDFRFHEKNLTESTSFDVDAFWVVIGPNYNKETGDDFYAVTLLKKDIIDGNGIAPLTIIYYKK